MSELESDVKQLQDELERQQVHLREADREKTRAVQELSEQNQRLLDQLSRVSHELRTYGIRKKEFWGGRRVQDGEHMYTCGRFILIFGKTNTIM